MMRVGIVGTGFMGNTHAAAWAQTPAQIAGMFSIECEQAQALAEQYHIPCYDTLDALIDAVDVVDICTPTDTHHEIALRAAQAGKDIVCEKPLALTLQQAREMIEACRKANVKLLVAHVVRFFPEYARAKAVVDRGDIGKVAVMRLSRCSFQPGRAPSNWMRDYARSGGMMMDLMIHDFDYARWVAGDVESVFAKNVRSSAPDAKGDYSLAILKHKSGAISNIEGAWAYPAPMFRTALEIAGDGGLIEHPAGSSIPLGVYLDQPETGEKPTVAVPVSPLLKNPYAIQLAHFYDILTGQESAWRVTPEDGLQALKIALAAIESAQTGKRISMEEV